MFAVTARSLLVVAAAMVGLGGAPTLAQDGPTPDLLGTWEATEGGMHFWHEDALRTGEGHALTLVIDQQDGAYFSGTMTYTNPPDVHGHDGSGLVQTGVEDFVGVIGWDGETLTFVDTPDVGYWHATLVDADTIAATAVESGEFAVAGRFLLKRQ